LFGLKVVEQPASKSGKPSSILRRDIDIVPSST
jgi:hypothetical protein